MTSVRIVTDSACDLPSDVVERYGIAIVPLSIRFGTEEFVDRRDLSPAEFWARCRSSPSLPETAAPAPGAFAQTYQDLATAGAEAIVVVNLSGALSATIEAARQAAREVSEGCEVHVVDSRSVSMGLGALVVQAAQLAEQGTPASEVADAVTDAAARTRVYGTLDTLENLKKGGRIGAAQSLLGSLLDIKPLIEVRDGAVEPAGRQRTRGKALAWLVDTVRREPAVERLTVMHAECDDLPVLLGQLRSLYDGEILVGDIGAVIGTHAGPRTIGLTFQIPA
jgi:DegV family protein with EDD domain